MSLIVIHPTPDDENDDVRLSEVLNCALRGKDYQMISRAENLSNLCGNRLLFAVALGIYGTNLEYIRILRVLRTNPDLLNGCISAFVVDGQAELYTKSTASELAFAVNQAGSAIIGRPLVEATGSLANFRVQAKILGTDWQNAYYIAVQELLDRLLNGTFHGGNPNLLALHASSYHTSNTMQLWVEVRRRLGNRLNITEIGLRNGTLSDCSGCPYTMCLHFGEKGRCFYGGVMQDEVYPAVRRCGGMILLCPNYNDALSANLTAFINRLTALFRQHRFYDKAVFAIIVSGYSGGDILARQVIAALNMNKSFYLPPHFAMIETANDPGEAISLPHIDTRLDQFAHLILDSLAVPVFQTAYNRTE